MNSNDLQSLNEAYSQVQEAFSAFGQLRHGSTSAKATDSSVSSAVDKALASPGIAQSASSEKGKTGVTGSGNISYGGSLAGGGGSSAAKPTARPTAKLMGSRPLGSTPKPMVTKSGTDSRLPVRSSSDLDKRSETKSDGDRRSFFTPMSMSRGGGGVREELAYEYLLNYLIGEGYASTEETADKIILNMSESWFEEIMELSEARAEDKRGLEPTGENRKKQKSGEEGPRGRRPVTSFSGGQNPHLRGKSTSKEYRRASSRRYVDQPGGTYGGPENKQGEGRYAKMQAKKRDQSHMHSARD